MTSVPRLVFFSLRTERWLEAIDGRVMRDGVASRCPCVVSDVIQKRKVIIVSGLATGLCVS